PLDLRRHLGPAIVESIAILAFANDDRFRFAGVKAGGNANSRERGKEAAAGGGHAPRRAANPSRGKEKARRDGDALGLSRRENPRRGALKYAPTGSASLDLEEDGRDEIFVEITVGHRAVSTLTPGPAPRIPEHEVRILEPARVGMVAHDGHGVPCI